MTFAPCRPRMTAVARPLPMPAARDPAPVTMATLPLRRSSLRMSVIQSCALGSATEPDDRRAELNLPAGSGPRLARLEHALQRRLRDLRKSRGNLGLLRRRHPVVLDGRHAGFADAAKQRLAKIRIVDGRHRMVVQTAAAAFGTG